MKRVMIADDSGTARMFIRRCLEIAGFQEAEFLEAANGHEAIALLRQGGADLVMTDLNMPECDGIELLKQIKADKELKMVPVVVVTSAKNPAKEAELLIHGAVAVLAKPVSPAGISAVLGRIQRTGAA